MTRVLLARHGQSTWNAEGRWQGQADPPLSELGREQAHLAAAHVGAVDLIASSPQQRALETATIISSTIGVGPVVVVEQLRERSAGPWSGLTRIDIDNQYPGHLASGQRPDGYESDASLLARTIDGLDQLAADYPGATLLVVAHGGVIHNLELHLGLEVGRVPNLAGRVLVRDEEGWLPGEQLLLVDIDRISGGDPNRI